MTFTIQRPCRHPGCSALVAAGQGTCCPAHQRAGRAVARVHDRRRGTAHERGYDSRWQAESRAFLAAFPLSPGVLIPAVDYTPALAQTFAVLREHEREAGRLIGPDGLPPRLTAWLRDYPIYALEPWDATRPAQVVDHIVPHKGDPALFWASWNWQPLTTRAHNKKTAREDRGQWSPAGTPR